MRLFIIYMSLSLTTTLSYAQVSVYDCSLSSPNVPLEALEASEPGNFHKPCVLLDELNLYNFSGDQNLHITADKTIHIKEHFQSGQYTANGEMHLEIKPQEELDVLLMSPSDLYNVERFGKMELAVVLPQNIQDAVDDFVANGQSASNINPFDPQQLEIKAYFSPLYNGSWQYPWIQHGFYYEEWEHTSDTLSWQQIPTEGSKFRIRFAPRATGLWRCAISVNCPATGEYWGLNEFQFTVIDTGKPDYVRTGENGKYLKIGGDPFYTWGMNMPTQGRNTAYSVIGTKPKDYNHYFDELKELKNAGGNYFRYMNQPYSTEIEFEHLGDYSDRMFRAWEMDRLIDSLETMDMRMHWCLTYNLPITYTGIFDQFYWDWSAQGESGITCPTNPTGLPGDLGYCYHTDPIYGVETVDSFFTDPDLVRYYQNRLRYYISRYGYSTRIGTFDFMNEINFTAITFSIDSNTCNIRYPFQGGWETKPYFYDESFVDALSDWQIEMARYIKEDLEHYDHLLTAHYGGPPNEVTTNPYDFTLTNSQEEGISTLAGDSSYISDYIDIIGYSDYEETPEHFNWAVGEIQNYRSGYSSTINKPVYFVEIGNGRHDCDDLYSYQQLYIMSLFTGAAGAGLPWEYNSSSGLWDSIPERLKGWEPLQYMPQFFNGLDLNHDDWSPDRWVSSSNKSEVVYLKNFVSDATKAIGIISNRTVNRYTMREVEWCDVPDSNGNYSCDCYLPQVELDAFPDVWENRVEIGPVGSGNELKIAGLEPFKSYIVEYFNVQSGSMNAIETKTSNSWGRINLGYPTLSSTPEASNSNQNGSMVLVKVRRSNEPQFRTSDPDTIKFKGNDYIFDLRKKNLITASYQTKKDENLKSNIGVKLIPKGSRIMIFPNPTDGISTAVIRGSISTGIWKVYNAFGQVVFESQAPSSNINFHTDNWKTGVYFVTWNDGDDITTAKLIVK